MPISIPPTPFSRGRSGPTGFPSPQAPLLASFGPASDDALLISLKRVIALKKRLCLFILIGALPQTLTLRAAFASSTYLLSQIHGPGRSSDDDLLISLKRVIAFKKGCAPLEHSRPLIKTDINRASRLLCSTKIQIRMNMSNQK